MSNLFDQVYTDLDVIFDQIPKQDQCRNTTELVKIIVEAQVSRDNDDTSCIEDVIDSLNNLLQELSKQ